MEQKVHMLVTSMVLRFSSGSVSEGILNPEAFHLSTAGHWAASYFPFFFPVLFFHVFIAVIQSLSFPANVGKLSLRSAQYMNKYYKQIKPPGHLWSPSHYQFCWLVSDENMHSLEVLILIPFKLGWIKKALWKLTIEETAAVSYSRQQKIQHCQEFSKIMALASWFLSAPNLKNNQLALLDVYLHTCLLFKVISF